MSSDVCDGIESVLCSRSVPFREVYAYRLKHESPEARAGAEPVLLIHAATLGRDMFRVQKGGFLKALLNVRNDDGKPRFDVLTLDWRGSKRMFGDRGERSPGVDFNDYRVDRVVDDIDEAVRQAADRHGGTRVHVVAHCIGAAATAQGIATRVISSDRLANVVLATIGLFYRVGLDGVLKTAENVMEGIEAQNVFGLSPLASSGKPPEEGWPQTFREMYEMWKQTIFPHGCNLELCNRLWFMYGGDYRADDMKELHNEPDLQRQFGAMPVGLYRHIIDNCRRGWAARWESRNATEVLDPEPFRGMALTLVTGSENQVWHRDSIDRMHEWLHRALRGGASEIRKHVFDRYGHVDLWWSDKSKKDVFPTLLEALKRPVVGRA